MTIEKNLVKSSKKNLKAPVDKSKKNLDSKISRAKTIVQKLKEEYPNAKCSLNYVNPLELLVATILSAQCTDERVNLVTKELFQKYKTAHDYANINLEELEKDIHSTGFFRNKARNIQNTGRKLIEDFKGQIPQTMEELLTLPGVARKTANVVLGNAFGFAIGVVVDTHVTRLSTRLGLTQETNPEKIEKDLMECIAQEDWILFSHLLISHGRTVCKARSPQCDSCMLADLCPKIINN